MQLESHYIVVFEAKKNNGLRPPWYLLMDFYSVCMFFQQLFKFKQLVLVCYSQMKARDEECVCELEMK